MIASDFLGKGVAEDLADAAELGRDKERLDKLLAHISYSRSRYARDGQKDWDVSAMAQRMQRALAAFFLKLPPERRVWFNVKVEH